jgi:6-phosphogluconolactonase
VVVNRRRFIAATGVGVGTLMIGSTAGTTAGNAAGATANRAYLGTYTTWEGGGTGIGIASYDTATGALTPVGALDGVVNPSFLIESPDGRRLYAVGETSEGTVTAVAVADDGTLSVIGTQPTGGADPCHLALDPSGRFLLAANYSSGSVSVHPLLADGGLGERTDLVRHSGSGPDPERQEGPHAHQVLPDVAGRHVLAVDLGTDEVITYTVGDDGTLTTTSTAAFPAGMGPRHLAFHPGGEFAYVAGELDSTVVTAAYDQATGVLTPGRAVSTLPPDAPGTPRNYPAEVLVSPCGRFVHVSNRGHDSIALFAVEEDGAVLRFVETVPVGGAYPRHLALAPSGDLLFAANQNSGTVTVFRVDGDSGRLTPAGPAFDAPVPVCFVPARNG